MTGEMPASSFQLHPPCPALVAVAPPAFAVSLDLAYARTDNLAGAPLYREAACWLHPDATPFLQRAIALAAALGLRLRLFDAYRPPEAQKRLWQALPDPEYVADPRRGSHHSRGVALDLTLEHPQTRQPLPMGTPFDDMSVASHHGSLAIGREALSNRSLLLGIMVAAGWCPYTPEWWHYQLPEAAAYPLLPDGSAAPPLATVAP